MLKYTGIAFTMAEVPDEISLTISISNCPFSCPGCHSPELQQDIGRPLVPDFNDMLENTKDYATCITFMGGDSDLKKIMTLARIAQMKGYKTCLYSGLDKLSDVPEEIQARLDYIKTGKYIEELGGLDKETTNQRMYRRNSSGEFIDITSRFWR